MNWRQWFEGLNWPLALFWSLCLLALLWGGQRLYRTNFVLRPAIKELGGLECVEKVELSGKDFYLTLTPPDSLKEEVEQLTEVLGHSSSDSSIYLVDRRSKELVAVLQEINLSLAQAASRGEFETMRPHWEAKAKGAGVEVKVEVGPDALYVTLRQKDHYLYEIIPRGDGRSSVPEEQTEAAVVQVVGEGQL